MINNLLFFQWEAFMQKGIEKSLKKMNIRYDRYKDHINDWDKDDEFVQRFEKILLSSEYDAVFSVNFVPIISDICEKNKIRYISWVYDAPIHIRRTETLKNKCNEVYFFDRLQMLGYLKDGVTGARHLPLAADPEAFANASYTGGQCDVSLVGQLYKSDFAYLCGPLDQYHRGYLEGIVKTQQQMGSNYILDELITDELYKELNRFYSKASNGNMSVSRAELEYALATEVTGRDRFMALYLLQSRCSVNLYSSDTDPLLDKVNHKGYIDYYSQMPAVFRNSKINLNISLSIIKSGIPLRVLDIMACGGFVITNAQPEIYDYFEPGVDIVIYEDMKDLVMKVQYYLEHEKERQEIAERGYEKVKQLFNFDNRLSCMLSDSSYENAFSYAESLEQTGKEEAAYYWYKYSCFLGKDSEDYPVLSASLNNLISYADVNEYKLGKALQELITELIIKQEYEAAKDFLSIQLYDSNKVAAKTALTEENMLLLVMLEATLAEKNHMQEKDFYKSNSCAQFGCDVYNYKNAYVALKFAVRRVWLGIDGPECVKKACEEFAISADMLAVVIKYSVDERYMQTVFGIITDYYAQKSDNNDSFVTLLKAYLRWFDKENIGGKEPISAIGKTGINRVNDNLITSEPDCLNSREIHRLDLRNDSQAVCSMQSGVDDKKIAVIFCTNDERYEQECLKYIKSLNVPEGMKLEIIPVWNAKGMAAGYNEAMKRSNARYKLYIHHDTFVIKKDMLDILINIFKGNEDVGMLGIFGAVTLPESALWYQSDYKDSRLALYQDAVLTMLKPGTQEISECISDALAIDGVFIATSRDLSWREDIFDGWHYYDISEVNEFRKAGYRTCLINDEKPWVMHETTMRKDPKDSYGKYREIYKREYNQG